MEQRAADGNRQAFHDNDFEFHSAIARGSRNSRLATELEDVYQECLYITRTFFSRATEDFEEIERKELTGDILAEHRSIRDAIVSGKPAKAEEAARASIRGGIERFLTNLAGQKLRSFG